MTDLTIATIVVDLTIASDVVPDFVPETVVAVPECQIFIAMENFMFCLIEFNFVINQLPAQPVIEPVAVIALDDTTILMEYSNWEAHMVDTRSTDESLENWTDNTEFPVDSGMLVL